MATKDFNTATLKATSMYGNTPTTTTGTGDAIYTVPSSRCAKLSTLNLCNNHSSAITFDLYIVPSGATAGAQHKVVNARSMAAGETLSLSSMIQGLMMGDGDSIKVKPSVTSVLAVSLTGVEGS